MQSYSPYAVVQDPQLAMYLRLQDALRELDGLKSGKTYTDMRNQVLNAEGRAQKAESKLQTERRKREAAEKKADRAYAKGLNEGLAQAGDDRKEMYKAINQNLADCANQVKALEDKLAQSEAKQQSYADLAAQYAALQEKYDSLWTLHFGKEPPVPEASKSVTDSTSIVETLKESNYQLRQEIAKQNGEIDKMKAQLAQDSTNSNWSSAKKPRFGPVKPKKKPSGKKQGGQPGHKGHPRKRMAPVAQVFADIPEEYRNNPDWLVDSFRVKQTIGLQLLAMPVDVYFPVLRNRVTGEVRNPDFPEDLQLEVNYDESVRAVAFLMKNYLNTSERKICAFLKAVSHGQLDVSHAWINGLNEDFANKTKAEKQAIFDKLASGPILHTDMTTMFVNGKLTQIAINSNGKEYMFQVRKSKGIEAQKGTPLEHFHGTAVSDGDPTYTHFGNAHQRCCAHILRPFGLIAEFEPYLTWHYQMEGLLTTVINERKEAKDNKLSPERIAEIEREYDRIVAIGEAEYKKYPPKEVGFTKGRACLNDLRDNKTDILHFLYDPTVPTTNAVAELGARWLKRFQANAGTFRGMTGNASLEDYCDSQTVLVTLKNEVGFSEELLAGIEDRFMQPRDISKKAHLEARKDQYAAEKEERDRKAAEDEVKRLAREQQKAERLKAEAERRRAEAEARGIALAAEEKAKAAVAAR